MDTMVELKVREFLEVRRGHTVEGAISFRSL